MAGKMKKPGIEMVFGMGSPDKADEEHAEASDALKSALEGAGLEADGLDNVLDALRSYIEACMHAPPPKAEEDSEEY